MPTQKYLFETFLSLSTKEFALIKPTYDMDFFDQLLPEIQNIINTTNLYFICKKPRLRFSAASLLCNDEKLQLGFELTTQNELKKEIGILHDYKKFFPGACGFSIDTKSMSRITVQYPNNCSMNRPVEEIFTLFDAMCQFDSFLDSEVCAYKVLYIGQSLGNKMPSNAYKRTMKHEKLQKILADVMESEPHNEVFIVLFNLEQPKLELCTSGFASGHEASNMDSIKHFMDHDNLSTKETIDIAEACCIKYFNPQYNILLKDAAFKGTEKFLRKCRKYDINSVSITVDTCGQNIMLFSEKIKEKHTHHGQFRLHLESDRVSLQDIIDNPFGP